MDHAYTEALTHLQRMAAFEHAYARKMLDEADTDVGAPYRVRIATECQERAAAYSLAFRALYIGHAAIDGLD